jgi:uncharacterized membrane protein YfcA
MALEKALVVSIGAAIGAFIGAAVASNFGRSNLIFAALGGIAGFAVGAYLASRM